MLADRPSPFPFTIPIAHTITSNVRVGIIVPRKLLQKACGGIYFHAIVCRYFRPLGFDIVPEGGKSPRLGPIELRRVTNLSTVHPKIQILRVRD